MSYELRIPQRAQKELASLGKQDFVRIREAIKALVDDPRPDRCTQLRGRDGWRIRAGDCRVTREIDATTRAATILHVGHRRDVYR